MSGPKRILHRHILNTVKNVTVAELELAFTRCQNNLKTVRNLTVRNSLQDFDAIERYLLRHTLSVDQFFSKSVDNCSIFIIFKCLHDAISKMCRLEFNFENLPFSKCAGKKCGVFLWPIRLILTVFKMCRHRVNAVLISLEAG